MTLFVGGPYHGRDLPIEPPLALTMRLPRENELDAFLNEAEQDPGATVKHDWPPLYRFVER